jgi:hypothetical protein
MELGPLLGHDVQVNDRIKAFTHELGHILGQLVQVRLKGSLILKNQDK